MNKRAAKPVNPADRDDDSLEAATQRGLEDAAAGRVVPHAKVKAWLQRWGHGEPGPAPKSGK